MGGVCDGNAAGVLHGHRQAPAVVIVAGRQRAVRIVDLLHIPRVVAANIVGGRGAVRLRVLQAAQRPQRIVGVVQGDSVGAAFRQQLS